MPQSAILIVDMLEAFAVGSEKLPPVDGLHEMSERIKTLLEKARGVGIPVIYVNDAFEPAEASIDKHMKLFGVHAIKGEPGTEVMAAIKPQKTDFVVEKKIYDGFYDTRLDSILRELEVKNIIVTGTWTHACVQHTVMGGWARGYKPFIVEDCVLCPNKEEHVYGLKYMQTFYGLKLISLEAALANLESMT